MGVGVPSIGVGLGGACAAGHFSHNHIDNTLISFDGGVWQNGDVRTGTVTNQSASCSAGGGSGSGASSGLLMNLSMIPFDTYPIHYRLI